MIRSLKISCLIVTAALLTACLTVGASGEYEYSSRSEVSTDVSFDVFYSNLSPHGSWLVSAEYGRVWQPYEYDRGWNPYYDGRWVYSDFGWTWVSDYRWGAIPYHYGTWYADASYGWVWVPGTVWAPSWVVFRTGPDYIGWCPVSPRFSVSASLRFDEPRSEQFVFVSSRDFLSPRIRTAVIQDNRRTTVINNTQIVNNITIENNIVVNRGPDVASVERASGRQVRRYRIEEVAKVAPGRTVDREQLRADRRGGRELRATEPVTTETPTPPRASGREDRDNRGDPRDAAESRRENARPGRPEVRDRERDRRMDRESQPQPDLRAPATGPEGPRPGMEEPDRSPDRPEQEQRRPDARPRNPRQDRPDRDRPDQDRPRQERPDQDRPDQDRPDQDRRGQEPPRQDQPNQRDRDKKHEEWLNPRDSGPGGRPAVDTPDQQNQDDARKPPRQKRPPRDERKQKQDQKKQKEKPHKPEEDKPPQDNGDDGGARR